MIADMIKEHCAPLGGTVVARYVANMGKVLQQNTNLYEIMHRDCKQQEPVSFVDLSDLCLEVYQYYQVFSFIQTYKNIQDKIYLHYEELHNDPFDRFRSNKYTLFYFHHQYDADKENYPSLL